MNRNRIWLCAVGLLSVLLAPTARTQVTAQDSGPVELTHTDLFGLPNWKHRPIAVNGFALGITRAQALEIANTRHLSLTPDGPPRTAGEQNAPCTQSSCSVGQIGGNWIGLDLFFEKDRITKIKVSVPADAYPEVKKVNVAREFKGLTSQFFNHYSDSLRNTILLRARKRTIP
jgi:hypothetical protein